MPSYEIALILRSALERVQLSAALKRTCQVVFDNGGTIRSLENLGLRQLPYAMKKRGIRSKHGKIIFISMLIGWHLGVDFRKPEHQLPVNHAVKMKTETYIAENKDLSTELLNSFFSYFIINFDSSPTAVKSVGDTLHIDEDVVRQTIILKEKDFKRPCLDGSCVFGELPNPDHEKFVYKESLQRKLFPRKKITSVVSKQLLGSK